MQIHQLKRNTPNKKSRKVGRGGKRGKTSGRGMKGQKARAGSKLRPEMRDIIKKLPKRRGHGKNRARTVNSSVVKPFPVNLSTIEKTFSSGGDVNPTTLLESGIVRKTKGRLPRIKILGMGEITQKIIVSGCFVSESAKNKIEKSGGAVKLDA